MSMIRFYMIGMLLLPVFLFGQTDSNSNEPTKMIRGQVVFQSFSIEDVDDPITELSLPVQIYWPVNAKLNVQLNHTPASSRYGAYQINAMSDTYLKANYLILNDNGLIGVGLGLPTGPTELESDEFALTQIISNQAFRFQLPVYGQGFTANAGLGYAYEVNKKAVIGLGMHYIFRNKYQPVKNSVSDFDPGDQIGATLGVDFQINKTTKISVDGLYTYYLPDKIRGREVFAAGAKINVSVSFIKNLEMMTISGNATLRQKGKNELWTGTELEPESKNSNGTQLDFDGFLRYAMNEQLGVLGFAVLRAYGENDYKSGDAAVFGLGGGIDYAVSPQATVDAGIRAFFGRLGGGTAATGLNGFEFTLGFAYGFK
jgi:opacity protein-like surface antigen